MGKFFILFSSIFALSFARVRGNSPPSYKNKAAVARWLVRQNEWGSLATISTLDGIKGEPFSNIVSYNEGYPEKSTGVTYFFVSDMDQSMQDIKAHNYTSFSMSEFQTNYCAEQKFDPEDPRCARLVMSGTWSSVPKKTEEYTKAKQALFQRHPIMVEWEKLASHQFYLARLN